MENNEPGLNQELDLSMLIDETLKVTPEIIEFFKDLNINTNVKFEKFASEVRNDMKDMENRFRGKSR